MKPANRLKIKTMDKGWCDKDILLIHACFQIFEDCVKEEKLFSDHRDWNANKKLIIDKKELKELYDWWKQRKRKEKKKRFDETAEPQYTEDSQMLMKLIKLRRYLWT